MAGGRLIAQAKINLALRVLARETSGYHQIETLFCRLALGDVVTLRTTAGARTLRCHGALLPPEGLGRPEQNLAWRAAEAYADRTGWPAGFAIEIEKNIPAGGGLGGGSTDAAAVLRILNALHAESLAEAGLLELGASLGSDVPFLIQDASPVALGWGRGQRLLALPPLEPRPCTLLLPGVPVGTAEAYGWLAELPSGASRLLRAADVSTWDGIRACAGNDFEAAVAARIPAITRVRAALREAHSRAAFGRSAIPGMSGSGSTFFVVHGEWGTRMSAAGVPELAGIEAIETATADRVEPVVRID